MLEVSKETVSPSDINVEKEFHGGFGHYQSDSVAQDVVRLCQQLGGWQPFTRGQLKWVRFGDKAGVPLFHYLVSPPEQSRVLPELKGDGLIIPHDDRHFIVTDDFVRRCHAIAPTQESLARLAALQPPSTHGYKATYSI